MGFVDKPSSFSSLNCFSIASTSTTKTINYQNTFGAGNFYSPGTITTGSATISNVVLEDALSLIQQSSIVDMNIAKLPSNCLAATPAPGTISVPAVASPY